MKQPKTGLCSSCRHFKPNAGCDSGVHNVKRRGHKENKKTCVGYVWGTYKDESVIPEKAIRGDKKMALKYTMGV